MDKIMPPAHRQTFFRIQPIDSLHVDRLTAASITVARLLPGQLHQFLAQLRVPVGG
jgi:hypothetical protein